MSKQKHIIEVAAPAYQQVRETMEFHNYECPVCHGQGGYPEQIGHNEYKRTVCDYCEGIGKVKAEVTINWKPDL